MNDIDQAASLLRMAHRDVNALIGMGENPLFADEIFGFHAQQAIEKALKAWLSARGVEFPLTHELTRLLNLLDKQGEDVKAFWPLAQYTVFAVQARYEECIADTDTPLNRSFVLREVRDLLDQVGQVLGQGSKQRFGE